MSEREARAPWMYLPYRYDPWNKSDSEPDSEDEMGHDYLDDEVQFGSLRGNIVGIRYYTGIVSVHVHRLSHLTFSLLSGIYVQVDVTSGVWIFYNNDNVIFR
jgi:hypothetical protein